MLQACLQLITTQFFISSMAFLFCFILYNSFVRSTVNCKNLMDILFLKNHSISLTKCYSKILYFTFFHFMSLLNNTRTLNFTNHDQNFVVLLIFLFNFSLSSLNDWTKFRTSLSYLPKNNNKCQISITIPWFYCYYCTEI